MSLAKSLWASIQGDPVFMRRVNGWLTMFWLAMIPTSYARGWLNSVVYVAALSLWALVSGHWSAWQAARVDVAQEKELQRQKDEPFPSSASATLSTLAVRSLYVALMVGLPRAATLQLCRFSQIPHGAACVLA